MAQLRMVDPAGRDCPADTPREVGQLTGLGYRFADESLSYDQALALLTADEPVVVEHSEPEVVEPAPRRRREQQETPPTE